MTSQPSPVEPSRSQARRKAIQRGESMPEFDSPVKEPRNGSVRFRGEALSLQIWFEGEWCSWQTRWHNRDKAHHFEEVRASVVSSLTEARERAEAAERERDELREDDEMARGEIERIAKSFGLDPSQFNVTDTIVALISQARYRSESTGLVWAAVALERDRQIKRGYTANHDDEHTPTEWASHMRKYLPRDNAPDLIGDVVKLAAMCVALLESIDRQQKARASDWTARDAYGVPNGGPA